MQNNGKDYGYRTGNYPTAPIKKTIPTSHNIEIIHPLILKEPGLKAFVNLLSRFEYKKLITPKPISMTIAIIPTGESIVFLFKDKKIWDLNFFLS